jgi:hypothetical protein
VSSYERHTPLDRARAENYSALVSSVRVHEEGNHDVVRVWNRGGLAGELVVNKGDGEPLARRLIREPRLIERGKLFAIFIEVYP